MLDITVCKKCYQFETNNVYREGCFHVALERESWKDLIEVENKIAHSLENVLNFWLITIVLHSFIIQTEENRKYNTNKRITKYSQRNQNSKLGDSTK